MKAFGTPTDMVRRSKNSATPRSIAPHTARYRLTIHRMRRVESVISDGSVGGSNGGTAGRGCMRSGMARALAGDAGVAAAHRSGFGLGEVDAAAHAADHRLTAFGHRRAGLLCPFARAPAGVAEVHHAQRQQHDENDDQPGDDLAHHTTLPGLSSLPGSSACLIRRMRSSSTSLL